MRISLKPKGLKLNSIYIFVTLNLWHFLNLDDHICEIIWLFFLLRSILFLEDKQLKEKKGMHQKMRLFKKCVLGYLRIKLSKQRFVVYFSCIILVSHSWNKGPWKFVIRHDTVHIWLILLAIVSGITLSKKWNYLTLLMALSTWTRRLWIFVLLSWSSPLENCCLLLKTDGITTLQPRGVSRSFIAQP